MWGVMLPPKAHFWGVMGRHRVPPAGISSQGGASEQTQSRVTLSQRPVIPKQRGQSPRSDGAQRRQGPPPHARNVTGAQSKGQMGHHPPRRSTRADEAAGGRGVPSVPASPRPRGWCGEDDAVAQVLPVSVTLSARRPCGRWVCAGFPRRPRQRVWVCTLASARGLLSFL